MQRLGASALYHPFSEFYRLADYHESFTPERLKAINEPDPIQTTDSYRVKLFVKGGSVTFLCNRQNALLCRVATRQ